MDIGSCVRSVPHELGDFDLTSKLSTCDMIALGAKYQANCLAALYNRSREHVKEKSSGKNSQAMPHSITLAELIFQIQDSRKEQPHTTVLKLSDSTKENCKRLAGTTRRGGGSRRDTLYTSKGKVHDSCSCIDCSRQR